MNINIWNFSIDGDASEIFNTHFFFIKVATKKVILQLLKVNCRSCVNFKNSSEYIMSMLTINIL